MFGLLRTLLSLHVCGFGSPHLAPVFEAVSSAAPGSPTPAVSSLGTLCLFALHTQQWRSQNCFDLSAHEAESWRLDPCNCQPLLPQKRIISKAMMTLDLLMLLESSSAGPGGLWERCCMPHFHFRSGTVEAKQGAQP